MIIIILAGYPASLGFPIMHPFHAICTNFTSLPPSHPSLRPYLPPMLTPRQLGRGWVGGSYESGYIVSLNGSLPAHISFNYIE